MQYSSGEHIDYALFGVLPAAIERDILIACGARNMPAVSYPQGVHDAPGSVVADNMQPKYARQIFAPALKEPQPVSDQDAHVESWHLDINVKELRWESYVKAGYYVSSDTTHYEPLVQHANRHGQGVLNYHFSGGEDAPSPVDLLVTGSVPAGSGLSSSAAMVVASTLAFLAVNGKVGFSSS